MKKNSFILLSAATFNGFAESHVPHLAPISIMVTPTNMDMPMLGFMDAPTDNLTFVAMANLVEPSMNHRRMDGLEFKTTSSGLGDSSTGALFHLNDNFTAGICFAF